MACFNFFCVAIGSIYDGRRGDVDFVLGGEGCVAAQPSSHVFFMLWFFVA